MLNEYPLTMKKFAQEFKNTRYDIHKWQTFFALTNEQQNPQSKS